jgi:hypothetical protein
MPLALNRTGTIFKKCDTSNHRPETVKRCASAECQHTCDTPEKCSHAWTLRYSANGKQVEKSFKDTVNESNGRTNYGSGKKLARDFQLKLTVDKRSGDITFAEHGKTGKVSFGSAVETYIDRMAVGETSKRHYRGNYRTHIKPVFGDRPLAEVAKDRDGVLDLLTVTMKKKSLSVRGVTRLLIVGTCDEAVKAGKLSRHWLSDIELADNGPIKPPSDFVFPSYAQVKFVADGGVNPQTGRKLDGAGICVWLMRGCGLRIEEALAVCKEDFKDNGSHLRVMWQATRDGRKKVPLKARKSVSTETFPYRRGCGRWSRTCQPDRSCPATIECSSKATPSTAVSYGQPKRPESRLVSTLTLCATCSRR